MEISGYDLLSDLKLVYVDRKLVRKVFHKGADAKLSLEFEELTTGLDTCGVTADGYRNLDGDRLVLGNCKKISVEAYLGDRVPLKLVYDSRNLSSIAENHINDVGCRCVGDTLKIFCVYCEEDVLGALTVEVARYKTLFAESLDDGFVANFAELAFQFIMFHCQ